MFSSAIMKLTAFCNLNCTYCYMFNQNDLTYQRVDKMMPIRVALRTIDRIAEHCATHGKTRFSLALHGGEPTLWPLPNFETLLWRIAEVRATGLRLNVSIQTNGLRLGAPMMKLLVDHDVSIGISLDGPLRFNDRMRVDHSGQGSYDRVMRTVGEIQQTGHGDRIGGFLCVAQPEISPTEFVDWAAALPVTRLDVLWPLEFNHSNPPWADGNEYEYSQHPTYGLWMAQVFEEWLRRDDPTLMIRSFTDLIHLLLGAKIHSDSLVNRSMPIFVVNTDGTLEYHDYLLPYSDGGTRTAYSVVDHSLDQFGTDETAEFLLTLGAHLPVECAGCDVVRECGGGFLAGRMKQGDALPRRRSVLCFDQHALYTRARELLLDQRSGWNPPEFLFSSPAGRVVEVP